MYVIFMLLAKTKKYKQDFNDPWNFLLHAPPWQASDPHQICWDIMLQGIVFIKCFILMLAKKTPGFKDSL